MDALNALDNPDKIWIENTPRDSWAFGGATATSIEDTIDASIAIHSDADGLNRNVFLANIGANDMPASRVPWMGSYQYIIDAIIAKWSDAEIFLVKPWRRGYEAESDSLAAWIDDLVAANPTTCSVGHDERIWLEGGDNGVTMSSDGVHYSTAGQAECANQWKAILGY